MWKNSLGTENSTAEKESLLEKYRQKYTHFIKTECSSECFIGSS